MKFNLHFLVNSTKGLTTNKFLIKNLTSTSGRLDIIFRCLLASFSFKYQNIFFHTVLNGPPDPPKALEFVGNRMSELPIDEIGVGILFQTLLDPQNTTYIEGISITKKSFLQVATELAQNGPTFLLKENNKPFQDSLNEFYKKKGEINSLTFILSDHIDLKRQDEEFLVKKLGVKKICLGAQSYLASHCIILLLIELKKSGFLDNFKR